mmetsp:Transcript_12259/g.40259  ORF Transcript_12259/g.40259 Transcript_12259/m.40259 type:complete len:198 (-) Transcript_12259:85-678(-)
MLSRARYLALKAKEAAVSMRAGGGETAAYWFAQPLTVRLPYVPSDQHMPCFSGREHEAKGPAGPEMVVRRFARASASAYRCGDVVAFRDARDASAAVRVAVRRVAAVPGDELVSDAAEDEAFVLPPEHLWVTCDDASVAPAAAYDSRSFGPLPIAEVIGRVVYFIRSPTDHAATLNSDPSMREDECILAEEVPETGT